MQNKIILELDKIKNSPIQNRQSHSSDEKSSAVIFSYYTIGDHSHIILTKRSKHLKSHAGQISFPGGKKDEADATLLDTALREWEEELGESSQYLSVINELPSLSTGTGFHITPFFAEYKGNLNFNINRNEVESVFSLNLDHFINLPYFELGIETIRPNQKGKVSYFHLEEGLLWGATCEMILRLLKTYTNFNRNAIQVNPNLSQTPFFDPNLWIQNNKTI
jgi:8-oxo-dGTP pyrophosphatase MutT (NUDIX family)